MFALVLAIAMQSSSVLSGDLVPPKGASVPGTAQVVLLPPEYAQMFNAEAQRRIDDYWEAYKSQFAARKEDFSQAFAAAYKFALETVMGRLPNSSNWTRTA